jgi:hypothetical protein
VFGIVTDVINEFTNAHSPIEVAPGGMTAAPLHESPLFTTPPSTSKDPLPRQATVLLVALADDKVPGASIVGINEISEAIKATRRRRGELIRSPLPLAFKLLAIFYPQVVTYLPRTKNEIYIQSWEIMPQKDDVSTLN